MADKHTVIEVDIKGAHLAGNSPQIKHKLEQDAVRYVIYIKLIIIVHKQILTFI